VVRLQNKNSTGFSLIEFIVAIGIMTIVVGLAFSALIQLFSVHSRTSGISHATSVARNGVDAVVASLRNDFVQFNTVPSTPLGVNFDLDDAHGPLVRDGILYYVDTNHTAQIYSSSALNRPMSAGMDDLDGDGHADVIGLGLVRQNTIDSNVQDSIDVNGKQELLWTLRLVKFDNIGEVSTASRWLQGIFLAHDLYIRKIDSSGPLAGYNIDLFRFSGTGPTSGRLGENEIGNWNGDGIINTASEVAATDGVVITLHVAEMVQLPTGRSVVTRDISSDLINPRMLWLYRQNGIVGLPDPTNPANIN
jgi:pilin/secretion family protein with methylation motif